MAFLGVKGVKEVSSQGGKQSVKPRTMSGKERKKNDVEPRNGDVIRRFKEPSSCCRQVSKEKAPKGV